MISAGKLYPESVKNYRIAKTAYNLQEGLIRCLPLKFCFLRTFLKNKQRKTVLFYPEKPKNYHTFYNISCLCGYKITDEPQKAGYVVAFPDTSFRKHDVIMKKIQRRYTAINYDCSDIS